MSKSIIGAVLVVALAFGGCAAPEPWEHGWQTTRVRATRYANPVIGYNIGFIFPRNPNDCDREELVDFMEAHGCWPYQMGGFPGAEMLVKCTDVTDRESANRKLLAILPDLDRLVGTL